MYTAGLSLRLCRQIHERQCIGEASYPTAGFHSESAPYTVYSKEREIGSWGYHSLTIKHTSRVTSQISFWRASLSANHRSTNVGCRNYRLATFTIGKLGRHKYLIVTFYYWIGDGHNFTQYFCLQWLCTFKYVAAATKRSSELHNTTENSLGISRWYLELIAILKTLFGRQCSQTPWELLLTMLPKGIFGVHGNFLFTINIRNVVALSPFDHHGLKVTIRVDTVFQLIEERFGRQRAKLELSLKLCRTPVYSEWEGWNHFLE